MGILSDFMALFYPVLCAACERDLRRGESVICTRCRYLLPRTGYDIRTGHPMEKLFIGNTKVQAATALFHFKKGGGVQRMMHGLKYDGRKDVGFTTGKMLAERWKQFPCEWHPELIVPVPLHPRRQKKRGYNQAEAICIGFSAELNIEHCPDGLIRSVESDSQTLKHRYERHTSMEGIFIVNRPEKMAGKKVLLVDDVVTTGATLIACAEALTQVQGATVMVGAIAVARR
jgi:ComF family protein